MHFKHFLVSFISEFYLEATVNLSLKLILGIACSFSLLTAAEQVPASIDVVADDAAPVVSSSSTESVAPVAETSKTTAQPSPMVAQESPAQISGAPAPTQNTSSQTRMVIQSKPEPIVIRVPAKQRNRQAIIIEKDTPSRTDVRALRNYYPIELNLAVSASIGSAMFLNSDFDMPDFSGLFWNAGAVVIFPLNDATVGMTAGVLFRSRTASAVLDGSYNNDRYRFSQMSIDLPLFFKFKGARSRLAFDTGVQMSINFYDKLEVASGTTSAEDEYDLMKASYRAPIDWSLVGGFSVLINHRVSFNMKFLFGISEMYNTPQVQSISSDFTPVEASMGVVVNIL